MPATSSRMVQPSNTWPMQIICASLTIKRQGIEHMIKKMREFADWANLTFNISKCASLSAINNKSRKYVESYSPNFGNQAILALNWEERYKYLGVQVGRERLTTLTDLKTTILKELERIAESLLTDWQKIEAVNIFSMSKTNYRLRASTPYSTWARSLDRKIRHILKPHIKLPRHTTNHFLYTPNRNGGVGL